MTSIFAIFRGATPRTAPASSRRRGAGGSVGALGLTGLTALTGLLAGCGGGVTDEGVFVSTMAATPTAYSRNATISVVGSGLDKGVVVTADSGCGAVTEVAGGDSQSRRFSCKVTAVGDHVLRARTAGGRELARVQISVPQPEVSMLISGVGSTIGTVVYQLDPVKAPKSVDNFLAYVSAGFYTNTLFHRVVSGFVIQGGGYTAGPVIKTPGNPAIALESQNGLSNLRGTLAMARTAAFDSATSQFYVNLVDNTSLDYKSAAEPGYAVFGKVVTGLEVVDAIAALPVRVDIATGLTHLPQTNVVVLSASQTK